ncbi:MAG: hypothetical protein AAF488_02710, partial [Planctomycetota bacterium]
MNYESLSLFGSDETHQGYVRAFLARAVDRGVLGPEDQHYLGDLLVHAPSRGYAYVANRTSCPARLHHLANHGGAGGPSAASSQRIGAAGSPRFQHGPVARPRSRASGLWRASPVR